MTPPAAPADATPAVERSGVDATGRPGEPATSIEYRVDAERTVRLLAETLARLHATPLTADELATPMLPDDLVADASDALDGGRLGRRRSEPYAHVTDERLVGILAEGADRAGSRRDRLVLTHGAPTLGHLWCDRGSAVGLVAWHRPAFADPYRDLAVAASSVAVDLAPVLVPVLFEHYGERSPDPLRVDWYSLAAELLGPLGADPG